VPHDPANPRPQAAILLRKLEARVNSLYSESRGSEWSLTPAQFATAVERSVRKRFSETTLTLEQLEAYLETLHADDLVLVGSCMEGSEAAWEYFVQNYRGYLRAAAGSITRGSRAGMDAQELADSLFAELFGLVDGKRGEASLFRYYHGRSSLKTWLRTVLAQRHIDRLRQSRRWESIEREDGEQETLVSAQNASSSSPDPHRSQYLRRFLVALAACMESLDPQDRKRLELYYAREKTLAEVGRLLGEHESSASRNLERTRRELRARVEDCLRTGRYAVDHSRSLPAMSEAQIALCFQYAAEDVPLDFRRIFPEKPSGRGEAERKESS